MDLQGNITKKTKPSICLRLVIKYPDAQILGHRDLDDKKFCPSFDVRQYLLNEDIPNYKFQDGLTSDQDLQELRDDGKV